MGIISRQIGWSQESNLLWQILKQLNKLTSIMFGLKPKYKVFTALLTQSGGEDYELAIDVPLVTGITYQIIDNDDGTADFTNVGAPNNTPETFFVATGTTPNSWGNNLLGQLRYNSGAPVAIVLENTIGNIWFTYTDIGYYQLSSESLFTRLKSTSIMQTPIDSGDQTVPGLYTTYFGGENDFYISTFKVSDVSAVNDYLLNTFIEIRVYN
jgi:hypothetical protein